MAFISARWPRRWRVEEPESTAAEQERQRLVGAPPDPGVRRVRRRRGGRPGGGRACSDDCHGRHWHVPTAEYAALAGVLADRKPPWLADLVERRLTARVALGLNAWPLARWLVRLAAIDRPAVPEYGAGMVRALAQDPPLSPPLEPGQSRFVRPVRGAEARAGRDRRRPAGARAGRRPWPARARDLAAFHRSRGRAGDGERPSGHLVGPAASSATSGPTRCVAAGRKPGNSTGARLIDECLDAFLRDFPPNHVGWYVRLHDRLAPSPDEAAERVRAVSRAARRRTANRASRSASGLCRIARRPSPTGAAGGIPRRLRGHAGSSRRNRWPPPSSSSSASSPRETPKAASPQAAGLRCGSGTRDGGAGVRSPARGRAVRRAEADRETRAAGGRARCARRSSSWPRPCRRCCGPTRRRSASSRPRGARLRGLRRPSRPPWSGFPLSRDAG